MNLSLFRIFMITFIAAVVSGSLFLPCAASSPLNGTGYSDLPSLRAMGIAPDVFPDLGGQDPFRMPDISTKTGSALSGILGNGTGPVFQWSAPSGMSVHPNYIASDDAGNLYVTDSTLNCIWKFTPDGSLLARWGSSGNGNGQFNDPCGISVNESGYIYIADSGNYRIEVLNPSGGYVTQWGSSGNGNGQFGELQAIAVNATGSVYAVDNQLYRVQIFTPSGGYLNQWGLESDPWLVPDPYGIAVNASGYIYISDFLNSHIHVFDQAGGCVTSWNTSGHTMNPVGIPICVAVNSTGYVHVLDDGNLLIFTPSGNFVRTIGSYGAQPGHLGVSWSLVVTPSDRIYTTENFPPRVQEFSLSGEFVRDWGFAGDNDGHFTYPMSVAVNRSGYAYVADTANNRIQVLSPSGAYVAKWGSEGSGDGQFEFPMGVAVDESGRVFVVDSGNNRTQVFTLDGTYITRFGTAGSGYGELLRPHGIAINRSGYVYVADSGNNRTELFSPSLDYLAQWGTPGSNPGQFAGLLGISTNSSGFVFTIEASNNRVQVFNPSGLFICQWGSSGTGNGSFFVPDGIDASGDDIYVADTGNSRIQKFSSDGVFRLAWGSRGTGDGEFDGPVDLAADRYGGILVTDFNSHRVQKFSFPIIPDFTANVISGRAPLAVNFTDLSLPTPTGHAWFFGDENYSELWTEVNASAGWSGRILESTVAMPDGSIILTGGYDGIRRNDTWRSADNGMTWTLMNASSGWAPRSGQGSVAMPDGSVVLMGGVIDNFGAGINDVWRSTDDGSTWILMNASAGWSPRGDLSSVILPDNSIVVLGGGPSDVWRSTDFGATWTEMTADAGWSTRKYQSSVVLPDGSIVMMGGYDGNPGKDDVWRSTDRGATWSQMTGNAAWSPRLGQTGVSMPDGSIVLMGGSLWNDMWRSTDYGATWFEINASAAWSGRYYQSSVAMRDGSIVLMGGIDIPDTFGTFRNDVWRFDPTVSSVRNPVHTYTMPGNYTVSLQVYNPGEYNSTRKIGYINVSVPTAGTIGVFRSSSHTFYLDYTGNGAWNGPVADRSYNFGVTGDIPLSGDWNNDGVSEIGVFRSPTHMFYLDYNGNGAWNGASADRARNFGLTGDIPVSGDWNQDGISEIGVFRPSTHAFYLDYNGNGMWNGATADRAFNFGITGDIPVTGDWNHDGVAEIGVFRSLTHTFYLDYNANGAWSGASVDRAHNFGLSGDIPVSGDWNHDGRTEIGVFRPATHMFYLDFSGNGSWNGVSVDRAYNFGITSDKPVSGIW